LQVSEVSTLRSALVATGFPYARATLADNNLAEFGHVMPQVQGIRRGGAAVLDFAYVAAGRLDGCWEKQLKPWDWAAGWLLVTEAGGVVTGLDGEPCGFGKGSICASNGQLHAELLGLLAG
jgi:myo-inositol-1(or 4)-monophosphatase